MLRSAASRVLRYCVELGLSTINVWRTDEERAERLVTQTSRLERRVVDAVEDDGRVAGCENDALSGGRVNDIEPVDHRS